MDHLDPTTITLIGGIIVTIIGSFVTGIVSIITALRMGDLKSRQDLNIARIDTVAKDTEAIKGHVNSEKTAAEGRQRLLENENAMLKEMIQDKRMTANLLAQAAAQRGRGEPVAPTDTAVLDKIETNTVDTAANTAKTDAKIDDLKK